MIKGLSQLYSREGTPPGFAFFAKNCYSPVLDRIINEKGTAVVQVFLSKLVENIVGIIPFGDKLIIFYFKPFLDIVIVPGQPLPTIEYHETIGVYDETTNTFEDKVTNTQFNWAMTKPITGKAKLDNKGRIIVVFREDDNPPRYVNLDLATSSDPVDNYNLTLFAKNQNIVAVPEDASGSFKSGAYFASIQYIDNNNTGTQFSPVSNPIYIVEDPRSSTIVTGKGSVPGAITNKGIRLTLTDVDTSFKQLRVAIISKINDVIESRIYKTVNVSGTTLNILVTGSELSSSIAIEEVITKNTFLRNVDNITAVADQLFVGGYKTTPVTDFQEMFAQLRIQWVSNPKYAVLTDNASLDFIPLDQTNVKTFMHGEVYAFYGRVEMPDNTLSQWFHIAGDVPTSAQRANSTIANDVRFNGNIPRAFQIEDTCSLIDIVGDLRNPNLSPVLPNTGYAYGSMSVWENENENYPEGHPYAGSKVIHHKFPSTRWLKENVYTTANIGAPSALSYLTSCWDTLGIRIQFPVGVSASGFKRIQIGYAKRDTSNQSILGYDVVQLGAIVGNETGTTISSGGNWDVVADGGGANNDLRIASKRSLRMHSPDMMILRPNVTDIYTSYINKMRVENLGSTPYTGGNGYGRIMAGRDGDEYDVYSFVSNWLNSTTASFISAANSNRKLNGVSYIPNNVVVGNFNNLIGEEVIVGSVGADVDVAIATGSQAYRTAVGDSFVYNPTLFEETILMAIKAPKVDFFVDYTDQVVVPCSPLLEFEDIYTSALNIEGTGDCFIIIADYLAYCSAPTPDDGINLTSDDGCRNFKRFLCESRFNITQRSITQGDPSTYHLANPKISASADRTNLWIRTLDSLNAAVNTIQYSKDYNSINDFEQYGIYNPLIEYTDEYPYAIGRSLKASRASNIEDGWRSFKPNDVFYTVRDKGRIINLEGWGSDNLLIHHERALFKTRDKAVLQTNITNISLGSGDLFALEPEELTATNYGHGGTQHKFSCNLSEAGYGFVDAQTGEVLLYKNGNNYQDITKGFRNFFREVFRSQTVLDNPLYQSGIMLAFDKTNSRLILSLKATSSFTMYFDFLKEEWYSGCDALPDFLVNTRKNLYSVKNSRVHKHGVGPRGTYYGVLYPMYVDLIVNEAPDKEKILHALEWVSRVEENGVVKQDETISYVTVWNDHFCTGKIPVNVRQTLYDDQTTNAFSADRTWGFNELPDLVKQVDAQLVGDLFADYRPIASNIASDLAWFEKEPLRGKYFIVRLEYSNIGNKELSLRSFTPKMTISHQ